MSPASSTNHDAVWKAHAACLNADPALWYPDSGTAAEARAICASCPVRQDCLQHALSEVETFGVWGGASERVRRRLRSLRAASPYPELVLHPSDCRCDYCRALAEHDDRMIALAAGRAAEAIDSRGPGVRHGTPSCYPKGCRRPECLRALREWRRQRRAALRAREEQEAS